MGIVFSKLVSISLVANWLILAVIVLRMLLKKAPRRITCILWAIVALRLILPFSIESPASMIPQTTSAIQEAVDTSLIHPETIPAGTTQVLTREETDSIVASGPRHPSVLPIVWCAGTCAMLSYLFFSYARTRHLVMEAVPESGNIWLCDAVTTPFILGLIRPRIYLPSGLPEETKEYVIAHERSHLRWKDHWWKPLAFVLLSVYWFDPFVWVAYAQVCRDIEFACDERVVHRFGIAEKKAYSTALLACSTGKRLVLACPVAFGETAVVQRVRNVLNYKRPRFWIILVSTVAVLAVAIGFLTVPEKKASPDFLESGPVQNVPDPTVPPAQTQPTTVLDTGLDTGSEVESQADEWADFPDGIRIDTYTGETFAAHVMLVRDPYRVYLATFTDQQSEDRRYQITGTNIYEAIERENAIAAVGTGLSFDGSEFPAAEGFMGFNKDNILIVADSMPTDEERKSLEMRGGCVGGPVLIINGKPAAAAAWTGYTARTAIGQRADGTVILISADGRTPESLGATCADLIDLMTAYDAVNACTISSGSDCTMLYRDTEGRYGEKGAVQRMNQLPAVQADQGLRNAVAFWMVKPAT